ncbi:NADH oxidoreductase [Tistrella bauzanensis]|uniref:NADH oxidoreductase n=1 Tax=Tistrella bauzanensis TaxID=657419 RepID=A0ABQ1I9H9_9PROT|nr:zinc-binding dehydrogenase [Tistrella bauzanensis]GGB30097.1 NADH oxidoreductase [Tistrella bauzanensis]
MADTTATTTLEGVELRSKVTSDGRIEVSLIRVDVPEPAADEVVVRIEATPINPSDLGLLLGPADLDTIATGGTADLPAISAAIPPAAMKAMAGRLNQSLPVGNEGAGVVIKAGADAGHLLGRTVAMIGGAMYARYRVIKAADCLLLPDDASPADGASCFVNPLTALGMVETMRREGHTALVHTAAASNLGQMLNRICLKDGIGLVNIVRNAEQVALLRGMGAAHVLDSTSPDFADRLTEALIEAGATIGFDAIGGGRLAGQILSAMEAAIAARATGSYSRYGSSVHKQVYLYGALDTRPVEIQRNIGMAWGVGGWLLFPFLQRVGPEVAGRLRARVAAELKTTFASHYTAEISLAEVLKPEVIAGYSKRATGAKYLINPNKGL